MVELEALVVDVDVDVDVDELRHPTLSMSVSPSPYPYPPPSMGPKLSNRSELRAKRVKIQTAIEHSEKCFMDLINKT